MTDIASIRQEYASRILLEKDAAATPFLQFSDWWNEALAARLDEPNAMTLATASADGMPAARIVLLKGFDEQGYTFFTNYGSYKGLHLAENPRAALLFFWQPLERQVRITGMVQKLTAEESEGYFQSRPEGSRRGAWASPQSSVVPARAWIDEAYELVSPEVAAARPPHWGGYRVQPVIVEFWQGRPSRLHDRLQYSLLEGGGWKMERLAP